MCRCVRNLILGAVILSLLAVSALAENQLGNSSGNLRNDCFAASSGGSIYYSAYSSGLWKMQSDGSGKKNISSHFGYDINVIGDWLYFAGINHDVLYKIGIEGNDEQVLLPEAHMKLNTNLYAYGDWLYFLDVTDTLYRLSQDGAEKEKIGDKPCEDFIIGESGTLYVSWLETGGGQEDAACCSYSLPDLEPLETYDFFPEFEDDYWLYFLTDRGYSRFSKPTYAIEALDNVDYCLRVQGDSYYYRDSQGYVTGPETKTVGYIYVCNPMTSRGMMVISRYCENFTLVPNWLFYYAFDESTRKMHHYALELSPSTITQLD